MVLLLRMDCVGEGKDDMSEYLRTVYFTTGKLVGVGMLSAGVAWRIVEGLNVGVAVIYWLIMLICYLWLLFRVLDENVGPDDKMGDAYGFAVCSGLLLVPSLCMYEEFVLSAGLITGALTVGFVGIGLWMQKGSLLWLKSILMTCLTGLLFLSVYTLIASMCGLSVPDELEYIGILGGIVVFSLYNAYDTHVLIRDAEKGKRDYVVHSVNYLLNIVNLFLRMLKLLAKMKSRGGKKNK